MKSIRKLLKANKLTYSTCIVSVAWCAGLLAGIVLAWLALGTDTQIYAYVAKAKHSAIGALVLPCFSISALFLLARFGKDFWMLAVLCVRAAVFAFTAFLITTAFRSAGWLIFTLMFLPDLLCFVVLQVFVFWALIKPQAKQGKRYLIYLISTALITLADSVIFAPFITSLFL